MRFIIKLFSVSIMFLVFSCFKKDIVKKNIECTNEKEIRFCVLDSVERTIIRDADVAICHNKNEFPLHNIFKDYKVSVNELGEIIFNSKKMDINKNGVQKDIKYYLYFKKEGYKFLKIKICDSLDGSKILVSKLN